MDHSSVNSFFSDGVIVLPTAELSNAADESTFYTTTGLDLTNGNLGNFMIKMDSIGNAMCSDTFSMGPIIDLEIFTDTLNIELENFAILDSIEIETTNFNGFSTCLLYTSPSPRD